MTTTASDSFKARYSSAIFNTFGPPSLVLERGEGVYVWDVDGKRYLDLLGGIAVNALGYSHPALIGAVAKQLSTLGHVSNFFASKPQVELGEKIQQIFAEEGYDQPVRTFFANSGTEANEAALKLTRLHKPGGKVLALTHSFHGRTMGALSITDKPAIQDPFLPLPGNVEFVEPTAAAIEAAFDDSVAAIFMEPIQGEAGVVPVPDDALTTARALCDAHNALLVIDEVQTGVGRTGRWLAAARCVKADIVTFAKGLGGGIPIGACVGVGSVGDLFGPGSHGSTFGGNPVACAAALATLDHASGLLGHVTETGAWLESELSSLGFEVRGEGLLRGIAVRDSAAVARQLLNAGFIVNAPNPTTIRVAPPLVITKEDLASFAEAMKGLAHTQAGAQ
ncbi:acetylornithine transaminase [Changpingibacter yushuensis]|uniref:acetylornithine transaminase n=1 Tax=Changpingibacter yushuensis TaxID=2758440 RepID=UPI00165DE41C|nr:acetylornithine transaminase [Changpingibacter yushuensis]